MHESSQAIFKSASLVLRCPCGTQKLSGVDHRLDGNLFASINVKDDLGGCDSTGSRLSGYDP